MLIATTNDLPGHTIEEVFGEVFGLTVRSRNLGSQLGAGLKSIVGGELKGMTKALVDSRQQVIDRFGRGGGDEGRRRDRRDALRHVGDGLELDGDLRLRDGGARQAQLTCPERPLGPPHDLWQSGCLTQTDRRKGLKEPSARVAAVKSAAKKVSAKTSINFVRSVRGK